MYRIWGSNTSSTAAFQRSSARERPTYSIGCGATTPSRSPILTPLADWGFNSVRLPMHWNLFIKDVTDLSGSDETVWNEEGFQRVDALIAWRPHSHSDYRALVSAPSASAMCRLSQPADSAFPQVSLPKAQAQLALHLINALILRWGTRWIDVRHFKIPFVRFSWPRISSSDLTQIAHLILASSRREPVIV